MHEIICPHCKKAFKIDEAGYADILKQVRDHDFEQQLHERLELAERDKQNAVELAKTKAAGELEKATGAKDAEIQNLKASLKAGEAAKEFAVIKAVSDLEKERDALANEIKQAKHDRQTASQLAEANQKLAITEAVNVVKKERDELNNNLNQAQLEKQLAEKSLKEKYETHLEKIRQSGGHSHFTTPLDPFLEYIAQFYNSDELVARIYEAFELFDVDEATLG